MDERIADAVASASASDNGAVIIEGIEVASFTSVVARLRADYPRATVTRIESIILREWEAFTAGRPLVIPVAVEEGVREILDQR